uniref:hypothetical protein n=1 Tax=Pseudomonas sp. TaxID=306 RepID=UPI003F9552D5
ATSAMQGAQIVGLLLVEHGSFLGRNAVHPVVEMRQLEKLVAQIDEKAGCGAWGCTQFFRAAR